MKRMGCTRLAGTVLAVFLLTGAVLRAAAQQGYVGRYDVYGGFTEEVSPALGLNQPGFHTQVGFNPRMWLSVGFDYSIASGSEILTAGELPAALEAEVLGAEQQYEALGALPPGYQLRVPAHASTQTFAFGPQYEYRHFKKLTLFVRPSLGALRERAVPHPNDPFSTAIAAQLAPAGYKLDWTGFYGVGGGGDISVSKHFGLRLQLDAVHDHPFDDILADGRWTYRFSVGPSFHFGKNVAGLRKNGT